MSRSYKKTPIYSNTTSGFNKGIKDDKVVNNRLLRRGTKQKLNKSDDYDATVLPERLDEYMDRWEYRDDGKRYYGDVRRLDNPWQYLNK